MEEIDIDDLQRRMEGAIASLTKDFQGLRTGRANSQLLDGIMVDVYGATMPINQVATVSVPEPRMLSVQIWDKDNVKLVEKSVSLKIGKFSVCYLCWVEKFVSVCYSP